MCLTFRHHNSRFSCSHNWEGLCDHSIRNRNRILMKFDKFDISVCFTLAVLCFLIFAFGKWSNGFSRSSVLDCDG